MSVNTATSAAPLLRIKRSVMFALARFVLVLAVTAAVVMFLNILPARRAPVASAQATARVGLVQKDADWHIVAPAQGGASGAVWYSTGGPILHFDLQAIGLRPGVSYLVELNVDGTTYEVSSHHADAQGAVTLDTALRAFATGVCDGGDYVAPRALTGAHRIKFLLKRDGNPTAGTRRTRKSNGGTPALQCHGNGDDDFKYALFEADVAQFIGSR